MRTFLLTVVLFASGLPAAAQLPAWDFTGGDLLGWTANSALAAPTATGDGLTTALDGADPWLVGPAFEANAAAARYVALRLKVGHHGGGSVYFATAEAPQFAQARMVPFRVAPGGAWQDIVVDMAANPEWRGTITRLRVDPIEVWPNIPAG